MNLKKSVLGIYVPAHFLVDFACAFLIFHKTGDAGTLYISFLLYNFCAFALQLPLGLLADRFNRNAVCAASGCVLVAAAYGFDGLPVAAAVIAGVGNGLFHIGGGIDVLNSAGGKAGPLGVFVAPGALGIFLGKLLGKQNSIHAAVIIIVLLTAAAVILKLRYTKVRRFTSENAPVSFNNIGTLTFFTAALCLFLVVCLRSYAGMTLAFPWTGDGNWGYALVLAVVLGKAAGGFLADRFGVARASAVTLISSAALFLLPGVPLCGVAAVLLFNMTMPMTLWAVERLFPGAKGFAFGLLTFGLFLGFVPVCLGYPKLFTAGAGFAAASAVSLVLLVLGIRLDSGRRRKD
jgi:FSR family fosmidomycin resistance protein-like MFS transporter